PRGAARVAPLPERRKRNNTADRRRSLHGRLGKQFPRQRETPCANAARICSMVKKRLESPEKQAIATEATTGVGERAAARGNGRDGQFRIRAVNTAASAGANRSCDERRKSTACPETPAQLRLMGRSRISTPSRTGGSPLPGRSRPCIPALPASPAVSRAAR